MPHYTYAHTAYFAEGSSTRAWLVKVISAHTPATDSGEVSTYVHHANLTDDMTESRI